MSYPSIASILKGMELSPNSASPDQLKEALWQALSTDLSAGMNYLQTAATECLAKGERILKVEDPNSALGKQLIRLLGTDVARELCSERLGVAFGFYNCCSPVIVPTADMLNLSIREQIQLQNGDLAHADC